MRALRVTDGTLQALGVQPMRGRWFTGADYDAGADGPSPVILSHGFWQRRFGGDEAALGRELSMDSPGGAGTVPLPPSSQVVGIMPPGFQFLDGAQQPDIIIPVRMDPSRQAHGIYSWQMLARLKPGVTLAEAQADLDRIRPIWVDAWPLFPGMTKEQFDNWRLARGRAPAVGRLGRRRVEHVVGAHGRDRRGAADRLRQHRESHARARGRAAAGVRRARRARRDAGPNREGVARREPGLGRSRQRGRLAARVRRASGVGRHRPERLAAPSGDRRLSAGARLQRGHLVGVGARVRLDHGTEARAARRQTDDRHRARIEREPRAERDTQHAGRRAGGAGGRARRERGADDSHVSSAARRRPRFCGSGDDSNREDLDSARRVCRPGANHPCSARDARQHRGTSGRPCSRFRESHSDGRGREQRAGSGRRPSRSVGRDPTGAQMDPRVAGIFRRHGHAARRRTRRDVERHRDGRPRGLDLRGFRSRAGGRARGRARQARSARPVC